eukprot:3262594-Rhodomonas_salina.1
MNISVRMNSHDGLKTCLQRLRGPADDPDRMMSHASGRKDQGKFSKTRDALGKLYECILRRMAERDAADTAISSALCPSILDDEQEDAVIREPGGISIQMEVKFAEMHSERDRWCVSCLFISGDRPSKWEFILAFKRPRGTTSRAWASDDDDIGSIFTRMAGLGYEAIIINRRRLQQSARAAGIDLNRDEL